MNNYFIKACIQIAKNKGYSILIAIEVVKIRTTMRSYNTSLRRAEIKNNDTNICW